MATILDTTLLNYISPIFIFLFVMVLFFAVLEKTKLLGESKGVSALVAFCIALLFMITATATELVRILTPWLVMLIIISMVFMMFFMFLGVKPEAIEKAVSNPSFFWPIFIVLLVVLGIALTQVFGPQIASLTQQNSEGFGRNVAKIIFHPKILSMLILLLIAAYAIRTVSKS